MRVQCTLRQGHGAIVMLLLGRGGIAWLKECFWCHIYYAHLSTKLLQLPAQSLIGSPGTLLGGIAWLSGGPNQVVSFHSGSSTQTKIANKNDKTLLQLFSSTLEHEMKLFRCTLWGAWNKKTGFFKKDWFNCFLSLWKEHGKKDLQKMRKFDATSRFYFLPLGSMKLNLKTRQRKTTLSIQVYARETWRLTRIHLQRVAARCSVLQRLQCVAACCSVLQRVAVPQIMQPSEAPWSTMGWRRLVSRID